jgi:hypothetical protein
MSSSTLTIVHKYIRREMFDMSQRLFRAAPDCLPAIRSAFDDVAGLLRDHAAMEEARLVPLLPDQGPESAEQLQHEHERLDAMLDSLAHDFAALDAQADDCPVRIYQLHLDWNRFVAMYLLHLDDEERTWFAPLQTQIPGVEHIAQSAAALGPQRAEEFLTKLWAVVTPTERMIIESARSSQPRRSPSKDMDTTAVAISA